VRAWSWPERKELIDFQQGTSSGATCDCCCYFSINADERHAEESAALLVSTAARLTKSPLKSSLHECIIPHNDTYEQLKRERKRVAGRGIYQPTPPRIIMYSSQPCQPFTLLYFSYIISYRGSFSAYSARGSTTWAAEHARGIVPFSNH